MRRRKLAVVSSSAAVAVALILSLAAVLSLGSGHVKASADYVGYHTYIDPLDATAFAFTLDSMTQPTGNAAFGAVGLGSVDFDSPAISIDGNERIQIAFEGPADLVATARIDPNFGLCLPGTTSEQVTARVQATIDMLNETVTADLWFNGQHYVAKGGRPANSPDHELSALVDNIDKGDYAAIYDIAAPIWRSFAPSRAAFGTGWAASWETRLGSGPVAARLTGQPEVAETELGYWSATATMEVSSATATATYRVILQSAGTDWLLFDMREV